MNASGTVCAGVGEPNARIEIRSVNGVLIGSGMADADGSYAITLDPPLDDGETVQVTQIDAAGNVSAPALAIAPDLTAPMTPDATLDSPTSVSGTGEPGATVTVSDRDGTVLGTAQVGTDGNFTVALSAPQTDGETLSVTQRDAAGNESDPALLVAPDTTAPEAPTATIAGDGLTVTGAGEPGATVRVFGPGGALIGSATVLGDGSYTIVLDEAQTNGQMLTAIQTDNAGNASDPVGLTAPDLDAPLAPVAAITPDGAILSGTGEIGATIEVRDTDGTLIGTDTVQPNGSYSITLTPPLIDGESVTVIQIDAAGNGSDPTPIVAPDLTAPEAPTGLIAADGGSISGTGEIGATIRVRDASGAVIGTATVDSDGNYRVDFDPALTDGEALSVTQSDAAGNVSPDIDLIAPDFTPPPAPSATIDGTGSVVTGTVVTGEGVAGSIIEVRDADGTLLGTATVDAQGNYTVMLDTPQVDGEALAVTQVDGAGNVSDPTPIVAPDLTAPEAPTGLIAADGGSISGTGEIGATIRVRDASGAVIGTATVDSDGNYRVDFDPALTDGEALSVTQSDAAGNVSPDIDLIAPDLTAPPPPTATIGALGAVVTGTGVAGADIEVRSQDGTLLGTATVNAQGNYAVTLSPPQVDSEPLTVTQVDGAGNVSDAVDLIAPDLTPPAPPTADIAGDGASMSGTGEVGATITITDPTDVVIGTATVNADGDWTATLTPAQVHGEPLTVVQSDAAGNESTDVTVVAPDLNGPDAPDPVTATISADGVVVSGSGEPLATVTVAGPGGIPLGTAQADGDGNYSITLDTPQRDGETLVVVQTDAEGNSSVPTLVTAPDLTAPEAPIAIIDDSGSVVTGTGEAGADVTVRDAGGTIIGTAMVDGQGNYAVTLNPAQNDGSTLSVTQTDAAGNESDAMMVPTPDLVAPDAPTGMVSADGSAVTGSGEGGATISVTDAAGNVLGTDIVDGNGNYSVAITPPLIDGEPLTVAQTDAAGNASPSIGLVAPDLTAPDAPTGTVTPDGSAVTGMGEAGATISVTDAEGLVVGTATVGVNGAFVVMLSTAQVNGETLNLVQTDGAGNASIAVNLFAPDITPPAAPAGTITPDGAVVNGSGEPGAIIQITDAAGTVLGTATVAGNGSFSVTLDVPQTNGEALTLVQTDGAGNDSPQVPITAPDITAPDAPTGTVSSDGMVVTGTGEAGATIEVTDPDGAVIGTATVGANGTYIAALASPQVNGETLGIVQTDAAGNMSDDVDVIAPDITAPDAPTGVVNGDGTVVDGTGEPGATIRITDPEGVVIGTATVAANGTYSATLTPPQINGETLGVVQADASGNASPSVSTIAPDLTAPAAPTGTVTSDGTVVTGTGEAGATIRITDPEGMVIGTATVAANGTYSAALTTPQVNGEMLGITQADDAGNVSLPTTAVAPDITAPAVPTGSVSATGVIVTGTGEAGATIRITSATGQLLATAIVAANGSYSATLSTPQVDGESLTLVQADAAGNISPPVPLTAPDITAPDAPTAAIAANGGSVTGTGEAGATVTVRDAEGMILGTGIVAAGGSYTVTLSPAQRNGEALSVTQTDGAGNESGDVPLTAPDLTAPDTPTAIVSANGATVTGTGEAGATITITNEAGVIIGTALVAANGSYTVILTTPQANGQTLDVIQTDAAGNVSPEISVDAPDITAPPAPANLAIDDSGTVVTGVGEAGATVEVRDGTGTLIGTGVVAANGSFLVTLSNPQIGGEDLTVTQTDLAGNQSDPGLVGAPFDIAAFDNSTIALVDLLPVTTPVNHGNASYVALVSLGILDLDAQVLGTPSVGFTVADGHSLNAVFTYDATLSIGVLSGYSVAVQQWNGSQWVAVDGGGGASLLELTLLNGNLVSTEALGPGQYRAFVTFNDVLGVGLLGSLNVSGTDADFTDVGSIVPQQIEGNVITDAGPSGQVDIVSPQTEIQSVTVNGVTTAVTADGTVVNGAFGRLTIDLDGSYSYTPSASAAAIGKTDVFQYTLIDRSDGETETANLSIAIGSDDITAAPIANDDSATAEAQYRNVVETVPTSQEFAFNTPILSTRSGNDSFSVAANSEADITVTVIRGGTIALLPTYTITVRNGAGQVVDSYTGTTVAGLPLGSGISHTFEDLPSGNYTYTVSSTNLLGTAYSSTVYISQSITHLDQFEVAGVTGTQGDLLANDVTGTDFPVVKVGTGSGFVEVGDTPVTVQGSYGTLTVTETGDYSYTPRGTIPYSTVDLVDSFTYQIVQPNGVTSTATLNVTIDVGTGVAGGAILAEPSSLMMEEAVLASDESMVVRSASPEAEASMEDDAMACLSSADLIMAATQTETGEIDPGDRPLPSDADAAASMPSDDILGELAYEMFEGQGQLEDVLTAYLDRQPMPEQVALAAPVGEGSPHPDDLTSIDVPQDPLAYLAQPEDLEKHTANSTSQI